MTVRRGLMLALTLGLLIVPVVLPAEGNVQEQAKELVRMREWAKALPLLQQVTREHPDDGEAWYGLGRSLQETGKYREALAPLQKALDLGHRSAFMEFLIARSHAALNDRDAVASWLGQSNSHGFPVYQISHQFKEFEPYKEVLAPMHPCAPAEFRQFDFWVGEWDVFNPAGQQVGTSRITSINDGCAIREEWTDASGNTGTSLNYYDPRTKKWNQFWVGGGSPLSLDDEGNAAVITGGLKDGSMVLSSNARVDPMNRITWTPLDGGKVRQHWEQSKDQGKTWDDAFDGTYVPKTMKP